MSYIITEMPEQVLASGEIEFALPPGVLTSPDQQLWPLFLYSFRIVIPPGLPADDAERHVATRTNELLGEFKAKMLANPAQYAYRAKQTRIVKVPLQ